MSCLHPVLINNPRFNPSRVVSSDNLPRLLVPCGHCYYCRKTKVNQLAMMVKHERVTCDKRSVFVTFTFSDRFLPKRVDANVISYQKDGLVFRSVKTFDFGKDILQKFFKRLRRYIQYHKLGYKFRYVACGEFGHRFGRCHYHALLLGVSYLQVASLIEKLWSRIVYEPSAGIRVRYPIGYVKVKPCDENAAFYVTKYMKKSSNSAWWNEYSPKYLFDDCLRKLKGAKGMFPPPGHFPFFLWHKDSYHFADPIRDCRFCPLLSQMREIVLNCKRLTRKYFNNAHKVSFGWMSTGLGRQYALDHMLEWTSTGFINNGFTRDGDLMRMPIPRNYRNYYMKDSFGRIPKFFGMTYAQIFPQVDSWTTSFCDVMDSDLFKRFLKVNRISFGDSLYKLHDPINQYALYHFFRSWSASQSLSADLGKDEFYESSIRPSKYNSVFRL